MVRHLNFESRSKFATETSWEGCLAAVIWYILIRFEVARWCSRSIAIYYARCNELSSAFPHCRIVNVWLPGSNGKIWKLTVGPFSCLSCLQSGWKVFALFVQGKVALTRIQNFMNVSSFVKTGNSIWQMSRIIRFIETFCVKGSLSSLLCLPKGLHWSWMSITIAMQISRAKCRLFLSSPNASKILIANAAGWGNDPGYFQASSTIRRISCEHNRRQLCLAKRRRHASEKHQSRCVCWSAYHCHWRGEQSLASLTHPALLWNGVSCQLIGCIALPMAKDLNQIDFLTCLSLKSNW